jgi:hypothetical protein
VQLTFRFSLDRIVRNPSDVVAWHLFLLFSGAFFCLLKVGRLGIWRLRFGYGGSFLVNRKNFKLNICCAHKP